MRTDVKSGQTPKHSKGATSARFYTCTIKAHRPLFSSDKVDFAEIICGIKSFVYFCIGKRTGQSTQDISYPHHSGVPGAVPIFGSVRLPKHKGASLFLCTYLK